MNILIPHSWLLDYIKTNATVKDIAKELSLHSFSVEKVIKSDDDFLYEIEVTPNRGDALSVIGIVRELMAVLPKRGFECSWVKKDTSLNEKFSGENKLTVEIKDKNLVPRFSAVVLDNVQIKDSPGYIKERLAKVGIRALGNVIDITNYMMIDLGQPMHAFDYDKILKNKMILRESKKGETVTTLDDVERKLPEGVILIEDGSGRLIDLCGIMGAKNSEVDENTKKVLLFVQVYDGVKIRKASMSLGHRTDAALRFEKGIDFEGVVPALYESVKMIKEIAGANVSSELIDIVNVDYPEKYVDVDIAEINRIAGVEISGEEINKTLESLGFKIKDGKALVPSWRYSDINISEDLAEEVIRLYGYYNLPNLLPTGEIPEEMEDPVFGWEDKIKDYLRFAGFFECNTTSATNKYMAGEKAIPLANPFSEDFAYFKTSLLPQLMDVANKNKSYSDSLKLTEMGAVYKPSKGDIPDQPWMLGLVVKGVEYIEFKGIIESMLDEASVEDFSFEILDLGNDLLGLEINLEDLYKKATKTSTYIPLTNFNSIKEDMTFEIRGDTSYSEIANLIKKQDKRISKVTFKDLYKKYLTLAVEYLDRDKQISSSDTKDIRKKIFAALKDKLGVNLKS